MSINLNAEISKITPSFEQTKNWRSDQPWYNNGKSNECEIYQRRLIEEITNSTCHKKNTRLHLSNKLLVEKTRPMKEQDGYEYSEDFDGIVKNNDIDLLFNLKMVCDSGGAQTRSLREVYHFIRTQLEHLVLFPNSNKYFINILDGNTSYQNMDKFNYLLNQSQYEFIKHRVFIGDMHNFQHLWTKLNKIV
jgi:hypothetical protein